MWRLIAETIAELYRKDLEFIAAMTLGAAGFSRSSCFVESSESWQWRSLMQPRAKIF